MTCRSNRRLPAALFVTLRHGDFDQRARIQHAQHILLTVAELDWLTCHAMLQQLAYLPRVKLVVSVSGLKYKPATLAPSRTAKGAVAGNDGLSASWAVAEFSFVDRYFVAGLNDPARIFGNLLHESFGRGLASFNPIEF